jgi:nitrogen regulatory protein PII
MKIVTAMVHPSMLHKVTDALQEIENFPGMTVSDVRGFGRRNIAQEVAAPLEEFIEKVRLEIVARDEMIEVIVGTIVRAAHTGRHGDGKVFVWPVEQGVRIRNGELDDAAL